MGPHIDFSPQPKSRGYLHGIHCFNDSFLQHLITIIANIDIMITINSLINTISISQNDTHAFFSKKKKVLEQRKCFVCV